MEKKNEEKDANASESQRNHKESKKSRRDKSHSRSHRKHKGHHSHKRRHTRRHYSSSSDRYSPSLFISYSGSKSRSRSHSRRKEYLEFIKNSKKKYKFDSPPKDTGGMLGGIPGLAKGAPESMNASGIAALLEPVETTSFVPLKRANKKLYVANLPKGITSPAVRFIHN